MGEKIKGGMAMELPRNCVCLDEEKMRGIIGGGPVPMKKEFLDKNYCLQTGEFFITMGYLKGMSKLQIAQELYAHAMAYYSMGILQDAGIDNGIIQEIRVHANPIDMEDGGDTWYMQAAYALIWQTC